MKFWEFLENAENFSILQFINMLCVAYVRIVFSYTPIYYFAKYIFFVKINVFNLKRLSQIEKSGLFR